MRSAPHGRGPGGRKSGALFGILFCGWIAIGCAHVGARRAAEVTEDDSLVGAWRSAVQFQSGAFASIKDLEFLYVFNQGGTLTESSNYDAAPPVAPAYGVWRRIAPARYEARYEFYVTKPPATTEELVAGGGWMPGGRGVFIETMTLSEDGTGFSSAMTLEVFGPGGEPAEGGGEAVGNGRRIGF